MKNFIYISINEESESSQKMKKAIFEIIFSYFTLYKAASFLKYLHHSTGKFRRYFVWFYIAYMLYVIYGYIRFGFAYYCIERNKLELLYEWDYFLHMFAVIDFNKQKLLILSFCSGILHCVSINYYLLFCSYKWFNKHFEDMLQFELDLYNVRFSFQLILNYKYFNL